MPRTRPPYAPEFRQQALRLLRNGARARTPNGKYCQDSLSSLRSLAYLGLAETDVTELEAVVEAEPEAEAA